MSNSETLANTIREDIENALDFFMENELVLSRKVTIQQQIERDTYSVAWNKHPALSYLLKSSKQFSGTTPISHFREILNRGDYNALLADGSIIQLAYIIKNEEVVWHRLCFFPCPLAFDEEDIADFSISDIYDVLGSDELLSRTKMVTPIRFDYNQYLSDKIHSPCHLTIEKNSCRLPVFGPLSVGHFINFVAKHFYTDDLDLARANPPIVPFFWKRSFVQSHTHQLFLETTR